MADKEWQEGLTDEKVANAHIILNQLLCKKLSKQTGVEISGITKVYKNGKLIASG